MSSTRKIRRSVLLMSGGIGDFLHYIARIPSFLVATGLTDKDLVICIESTVPQRVEEMFRIAFPKIEFWFTPGNIQWTRSNPLLIPHLKRERIERPAYRYLVERDVTIIEDWFLPFLCQKYDADRAPLLRIVSAATPSDIADVVVSARDKGFLWWPSQMASEALRQVVPMNRRIVMLGTTDEWMPWMRDLQTPARLVDALAISYRAELYVGTDTGLATIRELTNRTNLYCINQFWLTEMMYRYKYLDRKTVSKVATNIKEMQSAVLAYFCTGVSGAVMKAQ